MKNVMNKYGYNIKMISERFNIPYRTVQNWTSGQRECPKYIVEMVETILANEKETKKKKIWFTANNNGDVGCHDCDYYTALEDLKYNQEEYPDEEWEIFNSEDELV